VQPDNRPSLRSGLTAYVALSPGSVALLPPSPREIADVRHPVGHAHHRERLDASLRAPGPHDFAVREQVVVDAPADRSRGLPALRPPLAPTPPASTATHPTNRDDRDPPLPRG
jgi:hypothetical protein